MKMKHLLATISFGLVLSYDLVPATCFAQGSLTPPGAPGKRGFPTPIAPAW